MKLNHKISISLLLSFVILTASPSAKGQTKVKQESFGKTKNGQAVDIFTLTNKHGVEVKITNYGGIVTSLRVPDRDGKLDDVVLGFDNLDAYLRKHPHFGALIGRYGNRIARGRFTLSGVEYKLAINNGENHLHGGLIGYDNVVWTAKPIEAGLELSYLSKDGEEGYPGNLSIRVVYSLTDSNELKIEYFATTDKDTVVNLTNHSYFNLAGEGNGDILKHQMLINADRFTPTDAGSIPTGELRSVGGTPFDFRQATEIGARINQDYEQLKFGKGYDHNYVLNGKPGGLRQVASVYEPGTGRVMEVWTTEPGMQLYTGNFLDGSLTGKRGKVYGHRSAFCLETQHYPDSPNKPNFPSTVLKKGSRYQTTTIYKFTTRAANRESSRNQGRACDFAIHTVLSHLSHLSICLLCRIGPETRCPTISHRDPNTNSRSDFGRSETAGAIRLAMRRGRV